MTKPPICPYCNNPSIYTDSARVYSRSYGMIYLCEPCEAWVGVHKGTDNPLGRLANDELRKAKIMAHYYFDQLWRRKIDQGFSKSKSRKLAYGWLADKMGINIKKCHIGMFDVDQCEQVIKICKPYCSKELLI